MEVSGRRPSKADGGSRTDRVLKLVSVLSVAVSLSLTLFACAARPERIALPPPVSLPDSLLGEPVVALSDSTFWTLDRKGESNRLQRREVVWYRVNRRNPAFLDELTFYDDETTQDPPRIRVDVFYPDGSQWTVTERDLERRRGGAEGLSVDENWFFQTAQVPRYTEGIVIRCETSAGIRRPEFWSREYLRADYPCLKRYVSFREPASFHLRIGLRNQEALAVRCDTLAAAGAVEFRLSAEGLPKLNPARLPRYPEEWYAALHFSVPPKGDRSYTWTQLGDHYLSLIRGSLAPDASLKKAAQGLSGASPDSLVLSAYRLIKERVR
jgi:hypothetical protein